MGHVGKCGFRAEPAGVYAHERSPGPGEKTVTDGITTNLENLRSLLADGFRLTDVNSDEAHMIVTLRKAQEREQVTLGVDDAELILGGIDLTETSPIPA